MFCKIFWENGVLKMKTGIGLFVFCMVLPYAHGFNVDITEKQLGFEFRAKYDRVFLQYADMAAYGSVTLNGRFTIKSGIALELPENLPVINFFINTEIALPARLPLCLAIAYAANHMPEYNTAVRSITPLCSLNGRRAGISVGPALRFTSFYSEPAVFETVFAFSAYVNFYYSDKIKLGMRWASFDKYVYGNMGSYFVTLYSLITLLPARVSFINEIEIRQTGSIALAANFYGISYKGGILFQW
jgi:hypothetical protein